VNNTDIGITYSTSDDFDGDGYEDDFDNCPFRPNQDQADGDGDFVGDLCDNCKAADNENQLDTDADGQGDVCDADIDNDGVANADDNCRLVPNRAQADVDQDDLGDACDEDIDQDGVGNQDDPCPFKANVTTACDDDTDQDGVPDALDNCPLAANPTQKDTDEDRIGDNCDADADGDGVTNGMDNCSLDANPDQLDADHDGQGDTCDVDGFCLVVPKNPDRTKCLNPKTVFQVVAAPRVKTKAGEKVLLSVYANRKEINLNYQWNVTKAPAGASDTVSYPIGTATCKDAYECRPIKEDRRPTFTPTRPGEYTLTLGADLETLDAIEPQVKHAESEVIVTVEGDAKGTKVESNAKDSSSGCRFSSTGSSPGVAVLGLGLLLLALKRRRD
jgi:hypothetical protein